MSAWYYAKDGQQNGPVTTEEITRLVATGTITAKDLVWRDGMTDWKPAGELPELAPKPAATPIMPPPVAAPPSASAGSGARTRPRARRRSRSR